MENKIFLLTNNGANSANKDTNISVDLVGQTRLMPSTDITESLSLHELYNEERDNSGKFRLIFHVNPLCSNVCYNRITEVVRYEGSNKCNFITASNNPYKKIGRRTNYYVNRLKAIRNTEYSHPDIWGFTYHCGADIFNNHILRANEFPFIGPDSSSSEYFNTILDKSRDSKGNQIYDITDITSSASTEVMVYTSDNIDSMADTFSSSCYDKDGWIGFDNKTLIDIPNYTYNDKEYTVNKVINNEKSCSFIDLYPDRSLFSFNPKYNEYRNRAEYNWDYCITYPYRSDKDKFKEINNNEIGAIRIIKAQVSTNNSNTKIVVFRSLVKHNLKVGDNVYLYYTSRNTKTTPTLFTKRIKVNKIGNEEGEDKDYIFSVKYDDMSVMFEASGENIYERGQTRTNFFFKKNTNGTNCEYYFRIFKKYDMDGEMPKSELTKLSFERNIYGDYVSQIVFTDDINVNGLVDNLGRDVSELYLTIAKTNRGYKKWYYQNNYTDESIEYSHAFGKVTSGLDLPTDFYDYNIHKLHNINLSDITNGAGMGEYESGTTLVFGNFDKKPKAIEGGGDGDDSGITIDGFDEFYGDIVEFDVSNYKETVLEHVYHRFNTAQRECTNKEYFDYFEDTVIRDIYDYDPNSGFTVAQAYNNVVNDMLSGKEYKIPGNLQPEGYYYNPHYKVKIRETSDVLKHVSAEYINYDGKLTSIEKNVSDVYSVGVIDKQVCDENGDVYRYDRITLESPDDLGFKCGYNISFHDLSTSETKWGYLQAVGSGNVLTVRVEHNVIDETKLKNNVYVICVLKEDCPKNAKFLLTTNSFVWREYVNPSEMTNDMELLNTPFTNGAFYLQKNINFFLMRQDPKEEYGMQSIEKDSKGVGAIDVNGKNYTKKFSTKLDLSGIKSIIDLFKNTCE